MNATHIYKQMPPLRHYLTCKVLQLTAQQLHRASVRLAVGTTCSLQLYDILSAALPEMHCMTAT